MNTLYSKLDQNGLIEDNQIVLARYENGAMQCVDKETFESMFATAGADYEKLVAADNGRGYKQFFDEWQSLGIL